MCGKPHVAESFVLTMMNSIKVMVLGAGKWSKLNMVWLWYGSWSQDSTTIADFKIQGMRTGLGEPRETSIIASRKRSVEEESQTIALYIYSLSQLGNRKNFLYYTITLSVVGRRSFVSWVFPLHVLVMRARDEPSDRRKGRKFRSKAWRLEHNLMLSFSIKCKLHNHSVE